MNNVGMFFDLNREPLYERIPLDTPFSVQIEPCGICNIRCKYCAHGSSIPNKITAVKDIMNTEQFGEILRQLKQFPRRTKTLVLNGMGEPLVNPHIADFVVMAKEAAVTDRIELFTNGLLLTKKVSDAFAAAGLDRLKVSIQGMDNETYREVCGAACDFEKLYENLRYYSQVRTGELFIKIVDIGIRDNESLFFDRFGSLADKINIEHVRPWFYEYIDYKGICMDGITKYGAQTIEREVCPIPFMRLLVRANGDVTTCYMHVFPIPERLNCFEQDLIEIWNGGVRKNFLCQMLSDTYRAFPVCRGCMLRNENTFHESDNLDFQRENCLIKIKNGAGV